VSKPHHLYLARLRNCST